MSKIIQSVIYLGAIICFVSCSGPKVKNQNKVSFISTSIDTLALLINLKAYPPKTAIYQYTLYDNSAKSRLDISAPSDAYLEAILFYDTLPEINAVGQEVDKAMFEFNWLPNDFPVLFDSPNVLLVNDSIFSRNSTYTIKNNAIILKVAWN